MEEIDLSKWTLLSTRPSSANYISPDNKWILKHYVNLGDEQLAALRRELEVAEAVAKMGISTPAVGGIAAIKGGGHGAIYQNIRDKKSLNRVIAEDPSRTEACVKIFLGFEKELHTTPCDCDFFDDFSYEVLHKVNTTNIYNDDEKEAINAFINSIPKQSTCLHGDFHPGNIITSPQGNFLIDLGMFSFGNPIYDWAHWYFMTHLLPDYAIAPVFHTSQQHTLALWAMTQSHCPYSIDTVATLAAIIPIRYLGIIPNVDAELKLFKKGCPIFR